MRLFFVLGAVTLCVAGAEEGSGVSPDEALRRLMDGNRRFTSQHLAHPHQNLASRTALAKTQKPFAVILSCSDSRVAPEVIFDEGLGDIFVVRVAGNVPDDHVLGSIEYAVKHLGSRLVMVLGHSRCGAVTTAVQGGGEGHIRTLVESIQPAVKASSGQPGDAVENAIAENVRMAAKAIANDELIVKEVHEHKIRVVAARYNLDTGRVELIQ